MQSLQVPPRSCQPGMASFTHITSRHYRAGLLRTYTRPLRPVSGTADVFLICCLYSPSTAI